MGKTLVIAEKPSVARDIARVLKCRTRGEGYYENETTIVSWALGHLVALAEPQAYDPGLKKWRAESLPILPAPMKLAAISKTRSQLKVLQALMKRPDVEALVCATDSGREGELIFRYIYEYCRCKKPFSRLWISSMTDEAIAAGFQSLQPGANYDTLYRSAKCRSEADWLVGINATRAYSLRYQALLSIGRVQTPTLALIVDRQAQIDAFVPQAYWQVIANFGSYTGLWWDAEQKTDRLPDRETAQAIADRVKGRTGVVEALTAQEKREASPLLYDLTELQRDCNRLFGFSAQKTLSLAQSLYETRKRLTYPRTDSRYLTHDMAPRLPLLLRRIVQNPDYAAFAQPLLELPKLPVTSRIVDDSKVSDHHAIIPTEGPCRSEDLTADEKKVYDLVVRRFLAVFYPAKRTSVTKVLTRVDADLFQTQGTQLVEEGWSALYRDLKSKKKKEAPPLPALAQGDSFPVKKVTLDEKKTEPPKPYTEATLLSAMENAGRFVEDEALREQMKDAGLGTPATRAAIIERLLTVGYIIRKGKSLLPTEKGNQLIALAPEALRSPETTGKWERALANMARGGTMTPERFMGSIVRYVQFLVADSQTAKPGIVFAPEEKKGRRSNGLGTCPACHQGQVRESEKSFYCSHWKQGCGFTVWKDSLDAYGAKVDKKLIQTLLKAGKVEGLPVSLPQTGEKGTATVVFRPDYRGLELRDRKPL